MSGPNILFLCTGNSCRSQMGEALLRARAGNRFSVYSAGTSPKGIHPLTLLALEETEVSTAGLASKNLGELLSRLKVDVLIVVCDSANDECPRIFPGARERLFWPFDDPAAATGSEEEKLAVFRRVRDEIDARIKHWLENSLNNG